MFSRIILSVALSFFFFSEASAQRFYSLGGGLNICDVGSIDRDNYSTNYGFHFSLGTEKIFSDPLGLRMELTFNAKRIRSLEIAKNISRELKFFNEIDLKTIGIPILATLHFKYFTLETGTYFDFLISSRQVERELIYYYYGNYYAEKLWYDRQHISNPEIGFIFGVKVPVLNFMDLSARFVQGFTPIGREYLWTRNKMLQLSAVFRLGDKYSPSRIKPLVKNSAGSDQKHSTIASGNISRSDFYKVSSGNRIYFKIRSADFSTVFISDFTIMNSSGYAIISGTEKAINDVIFPFKGAIRYTVTNSISRSSYESYLEFQIYESGVWEISLVNN